MRDESSQDTGLASHVSTTCETLEPQPSRPWTSSVAASPVRTSAPRESVPASMENEAGFGPNSTASFASFDLDTSSWKTSQRCLLEGLDAYSGTWPRAGMTRNGIAYQRQPSAPLTDVTGYFWLPTPSATPYGSSQNGINGKGGEFERPSAGTPSLWTMARNGMWPTPSASLGSHAGLVTPSKAREGGTLVEAVSARMMWPTPIGRDWKSGSSNQHEKNSRPLNEVVYQATPGPLNPTWVEALMGFPHGWTALGSEESHE